MSTFPKSLKQETVEIEQDALRIRQSREAMIAELNALPPVDDDAEVK